MHDMTATEEAILTEFSHDVFDAAVRAGDVIPPWHPTREAYVMLHEFLIFGFSALQTAEALFAVRH